MERWFPRPAEEADVALLAPTGTWTPAGVVQQLGDPAGIEWRHKVGVAGPLDGSARSTTRLLASGGWVFKSRVDERYESVEEGRLRMSEARARGRRAGIWHPDKAWGLLRFDSAWLPLTICPELVTLRALPTLPERLTAWIDMLQVVMDVYRLYGLGLDVNPSNFGREREGGPLHYLDEDLYAVLDERVLGGAIASRLPEESRADDATWTAWGLRLRETLSIGDFDWARLADEIRNYPLPQRYESARRALLSGIGPPARRRAPGPVPKTALTCVFADVHANLAALDAVLRDARARGATDYLFLGDAVGYGPNPGECVARIADLGPAICVRGNHDDAIASGRLDVGMNSLARECAAFTKNELGPSALEWLASLPIEHAGDGWLAVHGAPQDPRRLFAYVYELTYEDNLRHLREQKIPLCFYGHTHVQLAYVELAGGPSKLPGPRAFQLSERGAWLVNPGSVGQPRDGDPRAAYALWNRRTGELAMLRVPYDVASTIRELRRAALPPRLEARLQAGA